MTDNALTEEEAQQRRELNQDRKDEASGRPRRNADRGNRRWAIETALRFHSGQSLPASSKDLIASADDIYNYIQNGKDPA